MRHVEQHLAYLQEDQCEEALHGLGLRLLQGAGQPHPDLADDALQLVAAVQRRENLAGTPSPRSGSVDRGPAGATLAARRRHPALRRSIRSWRSVVVSSVTSRVPVCRRSRRDRLLVCDHNSCDHPARKRPLRIASRWWTANFFLFSELLVFFLSQRRPGLPGCVEQPRTWMLAKGQPGRDDPGRPDLLGSRSRCRAISPIGSVRGPRPIA